MYSEFKTPLYPKINIHVYPKNIYICKRTVNTFTVFEQ